MKELLTRRCEVSRGWTTACAVAYLWDREKIGDCGSRATCPKGHFGLSWAQRPDYITEPERASV